MVKIFIKENAWVARWAAYKLRSTSCAIVFGKIICLHNLKKEELISNTSYLRHEVAHVMQWQKHGFILFPLLYVWYSIRFGYYQNPFEVEARNMESNIEILKNVIIS